MTKIHNAAAAAYFLLVALQGCVTYAPAPLVATELRPPDAATIRLRATAIQPAILKALDFYIGGRSSVATSGAVV